MRYLFSFYRHNAIALVCVVIFIFILSIISASILSLLASQTRAIEHNIDRIRALYAVESVFERGADYLEQNNGSYVDMFNSSDFDWVSGTKRVDITPSTDVDGNTILNVTVSYGPTL